MTVTPEQGQPTGTDDAQLIQRAFAPLRNKDFPWDSYDVREYWDVNYDMGTVSVHDRMAAAFVVATVAEYIDANLLYARQFTSSIDAGNCGVPRLQAAVSPLLDARAHTLWTDVGDAQVEATKRTIADCRAGNLGRWQTDQEHFERRDPRWKGCIQRVAGLAVAVQQDSFLLPARSVEMITSSHFHESATEDMAEWEAGVHSHIEATVPGGLVAIVTSDSSGGWKAGSQYGATPITNSNLLNVSKGKLHHVRTFFVAIEPGDAGWRAEDDANKHAIAGIGGIVGIRVGNRDRKIFV